MTDEGERLERLFQTPSRRRPSHPAAALRGFGTPQPSEAALARAGTQSPPGGKASQRGAEDERQSGAIRHAPGVAAEHGPDSESVPQAAGSLAKDGAPCLVERDAAAGLLDKDGREGPGGESRSGIGRAVSAAASNARKLASTEASERGAGEEQRNTPSGLAAVHVAEAAAVRPKETEGSPRAADVEQIAVAGRHRAQLRPSRGVWLLVAAVGLVGAGAFWFLQRPDPQASTVPDGETKSAASHSERGRQEEGLTRPGIADADEDTGEPGVAAPGIGEQQATQGLAKGATQLGAETDSSEVTAPEATAPEATAPEVAAPDVEARVASAGEAGAVKHVELVVFPADALVARKGTLVKRPYVFDIPKGERIAIELVRNGYITRRVVLDGSDPVVQVGLLRDRKAATPAGGS